MYFSHDNCQQDRIHGERLEDVTIVEKIMRSMLPKFNFVICSIEESKNLDTLSLDELQNSLMVHEQKIVQQDVEEQALQVTTTSKDFMRRKSKYGHYRSKCRTNLKNVRGENSNFVEVTKEEDEVSLLMVSQSSEEYHTSLWYLDTGCSNYLSGEKSAFSELDETFHTTVKFGDDYCIAVKGKGKVKLQTKSSSMKIISDVFFTPDLKNNLISVGQLQENGYEKRTKVDDKANKCVFMGVSRESKAYKLYNPINKMVIINRDVVFNEDNILLWEEKPNNQQIPLDLDDGDKEQEQPVADEGVSTLVHQEGTSFRPQRNRRRPTCMANYEVYVDQPPSYVMHESEHKVYRLKKAFPELGTIDYGILYKKEGKSELIGFTDSDFAGDKEDKKSTLGYVFMLGSRVVSWCSKKQPIVTLSTTEAEFVAATVCATQAIWLKKILAELHVRQQEPILIYCDNGSAIKLS
ncbi:uncharacterized protein LOC125813644 [Solanum verrucosum]|uniref:uncharacterized protein LOC125813644 n=1 Tax=Solanum verrucosum TaxID=315347 RepID=UPI0020D0F821|nr:uncharacterized protein LOC125813644 [Solanum verrucosum]